MTRDLVLSALHENAMVRQRLEALLAGYDAETASTLVLLKKENGRLTDAGIARLREMVDAGRTDTEIATELGITAPAVRPHRKRYSAENVRPKRILVRKKK